MIPTPLDHAISSKRPRAVRHVAAPPVGRVQRCAECRMIIADWTGCACSSPYCETSARWPVGESVGQVGAALYVIEGPNVAAYVPTVPCAGVN